MLSKRKMLSLWHLLALAAVISITGCAGAYHDYQGCCIPYLYCTPPPLPYVSYEGCHCPTPVGPRYQQELSGIHADVTPGQSLPISTENALPEDAK
jgi:hypothetical protein